MIMKPVMKMTKIVLYGPEVNQVVVMAAVGVAVVAVVVEGGAGSDCGMIKVMGTE